MLYKQYLIVNLEAIKNMNGNRGRMVTQGGHGWVHGILDAQRRFPESVEAFIAQPSAFKITLEAPDADTLIRLQEAYKDVCGICLVEERGTKADGSVNEKAKGITALGLGPIREDLIGDDLKVLKPFK